MGDIEQAWVEEARALELSITGDRNEDGLANAVYLRPTGGYDARRLADTISAIARVYEAKAEVAGVNGLVYAWVDQMSSYLGCSFCRGRALSDLPFHCRFDVAPDLATFAERAVTDLALDHIPWDELTVRDIVDGELDEGVPDRDDGFSLWLWHRPVPLLTA